MEGDEIKGFKAVEDWLQAIGNRSESTKGQYLRWFSKFCDFSEMNPDQVLGLREEEVKSEDRSVKHAMERKLLGFMNHLKQKEFSSSSQKLAYGAVRSFFECHYLKLEMRRSDAPRGDPVGQKAATNKEIRQMLARASMLRDRAIIMWKKDSGLRDSDVVRLKWSMITDMGGGFWHYSLVTKKRGVLANGFVGPETTELMEAYRRIREKGTDKIPPEKRTEDSNLFVTGTNPPKPLTSMTLSRKLSMIAEPIGNVSGHSLRKYFQATLEQPKLNIHSTWIKQMMGKTVGESDSPYMEKRPEVLLEAYKNAYPYLRVAEGSGVPEERLDALEEKLDSREDIITQLLENGKQKEREIQLFKKELEIRDQKTQVIEERLNNLIKKLEPLLEKT